MDPNQHVLPPPPAEIVLDPPAPMFGEAEYDAQGGSAHEFWYSEAGGFQKSNVRNHEYVRASWLINSRMIEEFEESLKEAYQQGYIEADVAQIFADIFGFGLSSEYQFTVTVDFTFTVEVPLDADPDSIVDNLNFEVSEGWGVDYSLDNVDYDVTSSDYVGC